MINRENLHSLDKIKNSNIYDSWRSYHCKTENSVHYVASKNYEVRQATVKQVKKIIKRSECNDT